MSERCKPPSVRLPSSAAILMRFPQLWDGDPASFTGLLLRPPRIPPVMRRESWLTHSDRRRVARCNQGTKAISLFSTRRAFQGKLKCMPQPATGARRRPLGGGRTYRLRSKYLSEVNACDAMNDAAALEDPTGRATRRRHVARRRRNIDADREASPGRRKYSDDSQLFSFSSSFSQEDFHIFKLWVLL
jgi:hypothetical protein